MAPNRRDRPSSNTLYLSMLNLLLSRDAELCPSPAMGCGSNPDFSQRLFYHNATSVISKLQDFNVYFSDHIYIFVIITDTWLREDIFDNEVLPDSYNIYRRNRYNTVVVSKTEMPRRWCCDCCEQHVLFQT